MNIKKTISESIMALSGNKTFYSIACYARNVSAGDVDDNLTCDAEPVDGGSIIQDVSLIADNNAWGFMPIPKEGSIVIVNMTNNESGYVAMCSQIDDIYINGNSFGGLVKVNDLVQKLNKIEGDLNSLKTAFNSWVVVGGDGGAALKAISATWAAQSITPTQVSDIENTKAHHGDGNFT